MVVTLQERYITIKKHGLSPEATDYILEELEFLKKYNLVTVKETTYQYNVYGQQAVLYTILRRISKDYTVELV